MNSILRYKMSSFFLLWVDFVMLLIILLKFDVFDFDWLQLINLSNKINPSKNLSHF